MIWISGLVAAYDSTALLDDASVELAPGRLTALIGRNGAGKSTLLRLIAGVGAAQGGVIAIGGRDATAMSPLERARTIAMVTTYRPRVTAMTCREMVAAGRSPYTSWTGRLSPADEKAVDAALDMVGASHLASREASRCSDGELQRVMIARGIAQDTPVMLLDEPTSFLDVPGRRELMALLRRLVKDVHKTVLFSTHEVELAMDTCDDLLAIDQGKLVHMTVTEAAESKLLDRLFS